MIAKKQNFKYRDKICGQVAHTVVNELRQLKTPITVRR